METTAYALACMYLGPESRASALSAFDSASRAHGESLALFRFAEWLRSGAKGDFTIAASSSEGQKEVSDKRFRVVPSTLAFYFHFSCDRYLYRACLDETTNRLQITGEERSATWEGALLNRGYDWERDLRLILERQKFPENWWEFEHGAERSGPFHVVDVEVDNPTEHLARSMRALRDAKAGDVICQARFQVPSKLIQDWDIDDRIRFSQFIPDLIFVEKDQQGLVFIVVDAKASMSLKLGHKIQASFYSMVLGAMGYRVSKKAGIWLMHEAIPVMFTVRRVKHMLVHFLKERLPKILFKDRDWHLNALCASCPYVGDCRRDIEDLPYGLSGIPHISVSERNALRKFTAKKVGYDLSESENRIQALSTAIELSRGTSLPLSTQKALASLVTFDAKGKIMPRRKDLRSPSPVLDALMNRRICVRGQPQVSLPKPNVDAVVFVTLLVHPQTNAPYVWGISQREHCIATGMQPHEFIRALYNHLTLLKGKRVAFAVLESGEKSGLIALLMKHASENTLARRCLYALTQSTQFVTLNRRLKNLDGRPDLEPNLFCIMDELQQGLCLPIRSFHTLTSVLRCVLGTEQPWRCIEQTSIFRDWNIKEFKGTSRVESLVKARLLTAHQLLEELWSAMDTFSREHRIHLMPKQAAVLTLNNESQLQLPMLQQLEFFMQYEHLVSYQMHQEERCLPVFSRKKNVFVGQVQRFDGQMVHICLYYGDIDTIEKTVHSKWMLCALDNAYSIAVGGHNEFVLSGQFAVKAQYCRQNPYVYVDVERVAGTELLCRASGIERLKLSVGMSVVMQARYVHLTLNTIEKRLLQLDQQPPTGFFFRMMQEPLVLAQTLDETTPPLTSLFPMTRSQQHVFRMVHNRRLHVVWGPPGSGKTYFIATMVLNLMHMYANVGRPFRVMALGYTKMATRHILQTICRLSPSTTAVLMEGTFAPLEAGDICLVERSDDSTIEGVVKKRIGRQYIVKTKYGEWSYPSSRIRRASPEGLRQATAAQIKRLGSHFVVAGTAFKANALSRTLAGKFHLLVVDEASQMPLPTAALMTGILDDEMGRIVVVGDHWQLAPIIQAQWPDHGPQSSLLDWLRHSTRAHPDACSTLLENHRMCPELADFAQHVLGYDEYVTCDKGGCTCRSQRSVKRWFKDAEPSTRLENMARAILRAEKAFILIHLASASIATEAEIVTAIAKFVFPYVVTPHHVQRQACLRALAREGRSGVVNTVEKMQGKEHSVVVACYGMEAIERELDFVYSRPRLLVALSRAKYKTILIVGPDIFKPDPEIFKVESRQQGFSLFESVKHWCEEKKCIINL